MPRALAALLLLTAQTLESQPSLRRRVQSLLQHRLDSLQAAAGFPGAQVGVVLPDGASLAVATGWADTATREPMTTSHRLLQGSVGKTYAAALAMQLVHEERLHLDRPVSAYLGDLPWFARLPNARDLTVKMLMNHTSGLTRYEFREQFTRDLTANPTRVWRPEELLSYILDTPPAFPAGEGWEYSDTNYIVLGMILERLTQQRYYDVVLQRVIAPVNLTQTVPSDRRAIDSLSQGYAGSNNPFGGSDAMLVDGQMVINPQFEWTGGGIASTAHDLALWGKALYEGRAFPEAMLPYMLTGVPARLGQNSRYGLGVIIRETPLGTLYGHSGFFPGYQAELLYSPASKVALALQINTSAPGALGRGRSPFRVAQELLQLVLEELNRAG
jgi:D-alanyl-D-alanine carboxypeptidase